MKIGKDFLFPDKDFIFYSSMCQSYHSICKVLIGTWQIILQVASHLLNMHKGVEISRPRDQQHIIGCHKLSHVKRADNDDIHQRL